MYSRKLNATVCRQNQQGFVLLTSLAFLVILTIIVLSTVNVSTSDEKIARNSRDKDIAFAAAEAAMRDAEMYLSGSYVYPYTPVNHNQSLALSVASIFTQNCPNALCDLRSTVLAVPIDQLDFINGDTRDGPIANNSVPIGGPLGTTTGSPTVYGVYAQPRYLIEVVNQYNPTGVVYRITVQAEGRSSNTRVTLQELYVPPN
jgi:type IV pilus assembly protein PilX